MRNLVIEVSAKLPQYDVRLVDVNTELPLREFFGVNGHEATVHR